jgi:hypothetical protein
MNLMKYNNIIHLITDNISKLVLSYHCYFLFVLIVFVMKVETNLLIEVIEVHLSVHPAV